MLVRLLTLLVLVNHVYAAGICDRKPKGATGNPQVTGNRYRIVIASNPETYTPEQQYTGEWLYSHSVDIHFLDIHNPHFFYFFFKCILA